MERELVSTRDTLNSLESYDTNERSAKQTFVSLAKKLKANANSDVSSFSEILSNFDSYVNVFLSVLSSSSNSLVQANLKALGPFLHIKFFAERCSEEQIRCLLSKLVDIAKNTSSKSTCNLVMWCLSVQRLPLITVESELVSLLDVMKPLILGDDDRFSPVPIQLKIETLETLGTFVQRTPDNMNVISKEWIPLLLQVLFTDRDIREKAENILRQTLPLIKSNDNQERKEAVGVITKANMLIFKEFLKADDHKDGLFGVRMWGYCLVLMGDVVLTSLIQGMLKLAQGAFSHTSEEVQMCQMHTWQYLINTFALSPKKFFNEHRLKLLMKPIVHKIMKARGGGSRGVGEVAVGTWGHLVSVVHAENLSGVFPIIIEPVVEALIECADRLPQMVTLGATVIENMLNTTNDSFEAHLHVEMVLTLLDALVVIDQDGFSKLWRAVVGRMGSSSGSVGGGEGLRAVLEWAVKQMDKVMDNAINSEEGKGDMTMSTWVNLAMVVVSPLCVEEDMVSPRKLISSSHTCFPVRVVESLARHWHRIPPPFNYAHYKDDNDESKGYGDVVLGIVRSMVDVLGALPASDALPHLLPILRAIRSTAFPLTQYHKEEKEKEKDKDERNAAREWELGAWPIVARLVLRVVSDSSVTNVKDRSNNIKGGGSKQFNLVVGTLAAPIQAMVDCATSTITGEKDRERKKRRKREKEGMERVLEAWKGLYYGALSVAGLHDLHEQLPEDLAITLIPLIDQHVAHYSILYCKERKGNKRRGSIDHYSSPSTTLSLIGLMVTVWPEVLKAGVSPITHQYNKTHKKSRNTTLSSTKKNIQPKVGYVVQLLERLARVVFSSPSSPSIYSTLMNKGANHIVEEWRVQVASGMVSIFTHGMNIHSSHMCTLLSSLSQVIIYIIDPSPLPSVGGRGVGGGNQALGKQSGRLWEAITGSVSSMLPSHAYKSQLLLVMAEMIHITLLSKRRRLKNTAVEFWNDTFGKQENLEYPKELASTLRNIEARGVLHLTTHNLPHLNEETKEKGKKEEEGGMSTGMIESIEEIETYPSSLDSPTLQHIPSQMFPIISKEASPPKRRLPTKASQKSPFSAAHKTIRTAKRRRTGLNKPSPPSPNPPSGLSQPSTSPSPSSSSSSSYVVIPPKSTTHTNKVMTDHQKEVKSAQKHQPMLLYNALEPSLDSIMSSNDAIDEVDKYEPIIKVIKEEDSEEEDQSSETNPNHRESSSIKGSLTSVIIDPKTFEVNIETASTSELVSLQSELMNMLSKVTSRIQDSLG